MTRKGETMNYFVFNKTSDYTRGYAEHVTAGPSGLLVEPGYGGRAVFFSRVMDSAESGTVWHRMTCQDCARDRAAVRISFYTAEELNGPCGENGPGVREVIRSETISFSRKKEYLQPFLKKQAPFGPDILLHSLEGRYIWFLLEIYPQTEEEIHIGTFMIRFPARSWMQYLPELYRKEMGNDSFLDRYLSIFQSLYDDVGERIRSFSDWLEPGLAQPGILNWMAGWLDVEEPYIWTEKQLRYLLEHIMEFYRARGTRRGIELFVELYTGRKPFVVEWQDVARFRENGVQRELLEELYEDDPDSFTVLVTEECVPGYREHQTLIRIIEQIRPVRMEPHLIVLKPYIFADGYSYLGVNSVLGRYEEAVLGQNSRLAFASVAGEERSED